jgi:lipid A 3-O-deacylase
MKGLRMMSYIKNSAIAALLSLSLTGPALATDYLSLNAGAFNALRSSQDQDFQFGAEYRFEEWRYGLHPIIGAFGTSESAAYVYAGLNWNVTLLPNQLYLVPNFAVGAYKEGDGKQLGGALEFRSGIEIDYQFPNQHQIGIALNHISNASLYDRNPGEESILLIYSIPVGSIFNGW